MSGPHRLKVVSPGVDLRMTWPVIGTESSLSIVGLARGPAGYQFRAR